MLTFAPRMLHDCFNVAIIDDDLYENPEEFFANITTTDPQVNISPMITVITIIDNDGKKVKSLVYCNIYILVFVILKFSGATLANFLGSIMAFHPETNLKNRSLACIQ